MEVSGYVQAPVNLSPGENIEKGPGWATEQFWIFWSWGKIISPQLAFKPRPFQLAGY